MKKIIMILALATLIGGCANRSEEVSVQESVTEESLLEEETTTASTDEGQDLPKEAPYKLVTDTYVDETGNISIDYLMMTGYKGELTQDYINQSLVRIIDQYSNNDFYEKVEITPEIWMTSDARMSIVYSGQVTLSGGRTVEVLQAVNIDVATSNEITFENLFTDGQAVRKMIGDKVIDEGLSETFEAEGIRLYMNDEKIFFAYMPLDDSARAFIKVSIDRSILEEYMNTDFGDHPAS